MSEVHLGNGTVQPPMVDGKWRLYSMKFCPYAQRCRMLLIAKKVPHDIINIDLKDKPEWFFKVHPEGKVPLLDDGMGLVRQSIDISNYINSKHVPDFYPNPDEDMKNEKIIIKDFDQVIDLMNECWKLDGTPLKEKLEPVLEKLVEFEKILSERGTTFFAGNDNPGMIDYMIWPWCERIKALIIFHESDYEIPREQFPKLNAWRKVMIDAPGVKETYNPPEKHAAFLKGYFAGKPNYDV